MKAKKRRILLITAACFVLVSILACSIGSEATQPFDGTQAALEFQLTQQALEFQLTQAAQQLTNAGPNNPTKTLQSLENPGFLYVSSKTYTPTATTHLEIGGINEVVSMFSKTYVNEATGLCLDSNAGGNAYTMACNGGNYQLWQSNQQTLVNAETGLCLDSNASGDVYTLACNGGNFQKWTVSGKTLINVATGLCLDSNASGDLYTMGCNGGGFQKWN